MKIFETNLEIESFSYLYTNRPFQLLKEIKTKNKNAIIITPFTKYQDIFNFSKDNPLMNLFDDIDKNFREEIININFLRNFSENVNKKIDLELVEYKMEYQKFCKFFFEIINSYVDNEKLEKILEFINKYCSSKVEVVIAGFNCDKKIFENVDILVLTNSLKDKNLNINTIEIVKFDNENNNEIFVIEDLEAFKKWLEVETKTVLTNKMFANYLSGVKDFNSFLIEEAIKKISNFSI